MMFTSAINHSTFVLKFLVSFSKTLGEILPGKRRERKNRRFIKKMTLFLNFVIRHLHIGWKFDTIL